MSLKIADFLAVGKESAWPSYEDRFCVHCDSGRTALDLSLRHWCEQGRKPSAIWLPHYLCQSVATRLQHNRVPLRFYEDGPGNIIGFEPPLPQSDDLVVVVHYFGCVNTKMLDFAARNAREWGLIEDCVQSAYSVGVGVSGEYAVNSMRKWWPAPDGAGLYLAGDGWSAPLARPDEGFVSRRLVAKLIRDQRTDSEQRYLELVADSEARLDASVASHEPSWVSASILESVDLRLMITRRRMNFEILSHRLQSLVEAGLPISLLHFEIENGEVPLAFPILLPTDLRDPLRRFLTERRIFCPVHWHLLSQASIAAQSLSSQLLSLPLDQRYTDVDMHHLADAISSFLEGQHRE